jgi:hypothetical protein
MTMSNYQTLTELETLTIKDLTTYYNQFAERPIKKFDSKPKGLKRIKKERFFLVEEKPQVIEATDGQTTETTGQKRGPKPGKTHFVLRDCSEKITNVFTPDTKRGQFIAKADGTKTFKEIAEELDTNVRNLRVTLGYIRKAGYGYQVDQGKLHIFTPETRHQIESLNS